MAHLKQLKKNNKSDKDYVQYFAPGGTVQGASNSPYTQNNNTPTNPFMSTNPQEFSGGIQQGFSQPGATMANTANPMSSLNSLGQTAGSGIQGLSDSMTAQNQFQAQTPGIQTQNVMPMLGQQYGNLTGIQGRQGNTEQMFANQAAGLGPNPAQAQYQQNINNIAQQQAGAIASQKGINPGLAARMVAQQGGMHKQQAAGGAATLQAQQQLGAQQQLAAQQATQAQQTLQAQQILQQANSAQNQAITQGSLGAQGINAQVAQSNANAVNQTTGGIMGMLSGAGMSMARGGEVPHFDYGGSVPNISSNAQSPYAWVGQQKSGKKKQDGSSDDASSEGGDEGVNSNTPSPGNSANSAGPDSAGIAAFFAADGGDVPQISSNPTSSWPGASGGGGGGGGGIMKMLPMLMMAAGGGQVPQGPHDPHSHVGRYLKGGAQEKIPLMYSGGSEVPGKAEKKGDSYKNDKVPAMLSPKEIVLPRSITLSKNAPKNAARFVAAIKARHGRK